MCGRQRLRGMPLHRCRAAPRSGATRCRRSGCAARAKSAAHASLPCAGLFESHNGGASFAPALHASVQREPTEPEGAHLRKFELVGCLMGVALLQARARPVCVHAQPPSSRPLLPATPARS